MFNPGGAVTYIEPIATGRAASFFAQGEGRFGVFCSRPPSKIVVDGIEVKATSFDSSTGLLEFNIEPVEQSRLQQNKVLEDLKNQLLVAEERKIILKWTSL